jgi:hypothetical protein
MYPSFVQKLSSNRLEVFVDFDIPQVRMVYMFQGQLITCILERFLAGYLFPVCQLLLPVNRHAQYLLRRDTAGRKNIKA